MIFPLAKIWADRPGVRIWRDWHDSANVAILADIDDMAYHGPNDPHLELSDRGIGLPKPGGRFAAPTHRSEWRFAAARGVGSHGRGTFPTCQPRVVGFCA